MDIVGRGLRQGSWSLGCLVLPGGPAQPELWDMLDHTLADIDHPRDWLNRR